MGVMEASVEVDAGSYNSGPEMDIAYGGSSGDGGEGGGGCS